MTTRRSFLKATAAALGSLLVPTWSPLLRPIPFDLNAFCDSDRYPLSRYDLTKPFSQRDFTYATDAKICVRTTLIKPDESSEERRIPNAAGLIWSHASITNWRKWPKRNLIDTGDHAMCPVCYGLRPDGAKDCHACNGYGASVDEFGEIDCDCQACRGRGWVSQCDYCRGEFRGHADAQPICDVLIHGWYDNKIGALSGLEFTTVQWPEIPRSKVMSSVVLFRFDGGEGIVAGMSRG